MRVGSIKVVVETAPVRLSRSNQGPMQLTTECAAMASPPYVTIPFKVSP